MLINHLFPLVLLFVRQPHRPLKKYHLSTSIVLTHAYCCFFTTFSVRNGSPSKKAKSSNRNSSLFFAIRTVPSKPADKNHPFIFIFFFSTLKKKKKNIYLF
jgi:hypothetical protein